MCRNDNVMENWYKFNDMKVPVNMVCGFDQSNNNMKEVYVAMMQSAFEAKGSMTCIPFEIVGVNYEDGKERYIHLKLGCDGKAKKIAFSQSNNPKDLFSKPGTHTDGGI